MGAVRALTLNLPEDLAERVRMLVESGQYDSAEAVVMAGLDALPEGDDAHDRWLLDQVGPAYDRLMAEGSRGVSSDELAEILRAHHETRTGGGPGA